MSTPFSITISIETKVSIKVRLPHSPEAFHRRIVVAVAFARHGRLHFKLIEQLAVIMGAILATSIRVMNQPWRRTLGLHGPEQRLPNQLLRHPFSHGVTDDFTGENILDPCQIKPAFTRRN